MTVNLCNLLFLYSNKIITKLCKCATWNMFSERLSLHVVSNYANNADLKLLFVICI